MYDKTPFFFLLLLLWVPLCYLMECHCRLALPLCERCWENATAAACNVRLYWNTRILLTWSQANMLWYKHVTSFYRGLGIRGLVEWTVFLIMKNILLNEFDVAFWEMKPSFGFMRDFLSPIHIHPRPKSMVQGLISVTNDLKPAASQLLLSRLLSWRFRLWVRHHLKINLYYHYSQEIFVVLNLWAKT